MDEFYPQGPTSVPSTLRRPGRSYRFHAWLAVVSLILFVTGYLGLSGWFLLTMYRLMARFFNDGGGFPQLLIGLVAGFLGLFMLKPLFVVRTGIDPNPLGRVEVTPESQPRLFAFLNRLADDAGAPRPYRVFLSSEINARVRYDLTILNLFLPSKKDLEIGLGLVNLLSLGELKAVLAHEFGHFAQRTMAVSRWVYIAQQVTARMVSRRDTLDDLIDLLSSQYVWIAWICWPISVLIWAVRALVETVFDLVILSQRLLNREMEMQADLVAVALTGSDALVHALHRLHGADQAWMIAQDFMLSELAKGRITKDAFRLQKKVIEQLQRIYDDPSICGAPAPSPPTASGETPRIFRPEIAHPPRMWSTHPLNHEREENARRIYVSAELDARSAWELFETPTELCQTMTEQMFNGHDSSGQVTTVPIEVTLAEFERVCSRVSLNPSYRGIYLGRSLVSHAERFEELYDDLNTVDLDTSVAPGPDSIREELDVWRNLSREITLLEGLRDGLMTAPNGVISYRGQNLQRRELPAIIDKIEEELGVVRDAVQTFDRRSRTYHRAVAARLGRGWEEYLVGLLHTLHYAEQSMANLDDAMGVLKNTYAVVVAERRFNTRRLQRLVSAGRGIYLALQSIHGQRDQLHLDESFNSGIGADSWSSVIGEFKLPPPTAENIFEWMSSIRGWYINAHQALFRLSRLTMDRLLEVESKVVAWAPLGEADEDAPVWGAIPGDYPVRLPGSEREVEQCLGWWIRFRYAPGVGPTLARFVIACFIVGFILIAGDLIRQPRLAAERGFSRPGLVQINDAARRGLAGGGDQSSAKASDSIYRVESGNYS